MMTATNKTLSIVALALGGLLMGCGGADDEGAELEQLDFADSAEVVVDNEVYISVPTPSELISFINAAHQSFNNELLNPTSAASNYADSRAKALNFGVYGTDMVYAASYGEGTESLKYFAVLSKLGDELEIASAFSAEMMKKMEKDLSSAEALMSISDDTYYAAYSYLEQNDRGNTLSLIIAGGWVESVFLASHLVKKFDAQSPTILRLTDQKLALENLIDFMSHHKDDPHVVQAIADLTELLILFHDIKEIEVPVEEKKGGRKVLGGAKKTKMERRMTEDQFKKIKAKVAMLRKGIVETAT